MKGLLALYLGALAVAITSLGLSIASLLHSDWIVLQPFSSNSSHSPIHLSTRSTFGLFETCTTTTYASDSPEARSGVKSSTQCRKFPIRGTDCKIRKRDRKAATGRSTSLQGLDQEVFGLGRDDALEWVQQQRGQVEVLKKHEESFCDRWLLAGYAHQLSLIFSVTSLLSLFLTLLGTMTVGRGYRTEKLRSGWKLVVGLMSFQATCLLVGWAIIRWEVSHEPLFQIPFGSRKLGASSSTSTFGLSRCLLSSIKSLTNSDLSLERRAGPAFAESVAAFSLLVFTILSILFVRVTQRLRIVPEAAAREDGYDEIDD
ncbi:hypothetical protein JCM10212_006469 [Sporobolomyces blumeae]